MKRFLFAAVLLTIILTVVLTMLFNSLGSPVAIGSGLLTGWVIAFWFARTKKRVPTKREQFTFIGSYAAIIAFFVGGLIFVSSSPSNAGLIKLTMLVVAYPAFLSVTFNSKQIAKHLLPIKA